MIRQELIKIFELKKLLLLFALGDIFYILFFQINIGIPAYSSESVYVEVSLEFKEKYGNELDDEEYKELLNDSSHTEDSNIDVWVKKNEEFRQHGVESYAELLEKQDSFPDDVAASLTSQVLTQFSEEERQAALDEIWRERYKKILLDSYQAETKSIRQTAYYGNLSEQMQERLTERNREEVHSLMPDSVMRKYLMILPDFAVFLFLSIILLVVPYSVKDTVEGVTVLQYTSEKGTGFYGKKILAVFIASLMLCIIEIVMLMLMLRENSAFQLPLIILSFVISLKIMPCFAEMTQNITLLCAIPFLFILAAVAGNVVRYVAIRLLEYI